MTILQNVALALDLTPDVISASESEVAVPNAPMRLGIDGEALRAPLSGIGHYVFRLCRELERLLPDALLFLYSRLPASHLVVPSSRWVVRCETNAGFRRLPSFVWLKTRGATLCSHDRLDVFWANRTLHPRLKDPVRTVCTVHDVNHLLVPDTMQAPTLWSHRTWFRGDLACADGVVANSRGTAQRVQALLRRPVSGVVAPGLEPSFRLPSAKEREQGRRHLLAIGVRPPYLLSVATQEPRKNIRVLIEAFVELRQRGLLDGYSLILAGPAGWKNRVSDRAIREATCYGVVTIGYVPRELLPSLYANAELFVLPSLYEGFGMPVLEARACGARIVISDTPELREVGGPHATAVQPSRAGVREGIQRAILSPPVFEDALAEEYSWSRAAAQLATILTSFVRESPRSA